MEMATSAAMRIRSEITPACHTPRRRPRTEATPTKASMVAMVMIAARRRPEATGARTRMPHNVYQAHRIGLRSARTSKVSPRFRVTPSWGDRHKSHAPMIPATIRPTMARTERTLTADTERFTTWPANETRRETPPMGVTNVKARSAAVLLRTQPQPRPVMAVTTSKVHKPMRSAPRVWPTRLRTGAPGPAQTQPRNTTPSTAGAFTPAATAHRTMPGTTPKRRVRARPAMTRPIMRASLCAPLISVVSASGLPAPNRIDSAGSRPKARARVGVAATIRARPASSSRRSNMMSGRILWPDAAVKAPSKAKKVGP